jgi:hypothetical protein
MAGSVDRKRNKASTIVPFNKKNELDNIHPTSTERDYKKLLEDKIKEKKLNIEVDVKGIKKGSREHIQKKKKWMNEIIKPMMEINDVLGQTGLIEINLIYRQGKVALNDLKNVTIKSKEYDESKIIKTGFKLDIDFCPRSQTLNNKMDCYLVQLLGNIVDHKSVTKYYNVDALMDFIINYCSEYIAEVYSKK